MRSIASRRRIPSFRVRTDEESGQTIISGMGELHLEILVDRMKREFGVEANVGAPQVAYREAIKKLVQVEGKFIKQSGGRGQYGHVWLKMEPNEQGKGFEFVDAIKGGTVPREYIPAVEKGLQETLPNGVLAGFPVVDVKVTLFDGSSHDVDSNENAFKMAASIAFKDGMRQASPMLLEPMMAVEVETPEDFMGNVVGRPVVAARHDPGHGRHAHRQGRSRPRCRWPRCSATRRRCVRCRRVAPRTRWNSSTTPRRPRSVAEAVINKKS